MFKLRLYRTEPYSATDDSIRLDRDTACKRCDLHEGVKTVCMPGDGEPGGLVVVGDGPAVLEDRAGRPFMSETGLYVRDRVDRLWKGPVVWRYATGCARGEQALTDRHLAACRPFLAAALVESRPTRVLALGERAYFGITGRKVPFMSVERAYSYLYNVNDEPVPCFYLPHPRAASLNPFIGAQFNRTIKWALGDRHGALPAPTHVVARLCRDARDTDEAVAKMRAGPCTFDVETCGVQYTGNFRVLSLAVTRVQDMATFQWDEESLAEEMARPQSPLRAWFGDERCDKIGHFRTYDCASVALRYGAQVRGAGSDTRIWHKLLKAHSVGVAKLDIVSEQAGCGGAKGDMERLLAQVSKPLQSALRSFETERKKRSAGVPYAPTKKTLANRKALQDLQEQHPDIHALVLQYPTEHKRWAFGLVAEVNPAELARYNCRDTVATARVTQVLLDRFKRDPDLDAFRQQVPDRAEKAVERVQFWGVPVNLAAIMAFDQILTTKLEPLVKWFEGEKLEPHNPDQIAHYLFTKLGIKPPKVLESGHFSTDAKVLEGLRSDHPVVQKILDFRKYDGFRTKYARGLLPHVHDGRIHPTIWLDGARTGRTSVSDPPLQQIPKSKKSEEGRLARSCYAAEAGYSILSLDYSQLELRIAALLSGDKMMQQIFIDGVDYHQKTAELICGGVWGIKPSEVTAWHREVAKTLNFSMLYGAGDASIAAKLSIEALKAGEPPVTEQDVARIRAAVMSRLTGLAAHIRRVEDEVTRTGEVRTWWDGKLARRRQLWEIAEPGDHDEARRRRGKARRAAFNTGVQGTANDFCVASMASVVEWIESDHLADDVQLVLPVHDQLILHVRDRLIPVVARRVRDIMQGWNSGPVPLVVDIEVGQSWGTLAKWQEAA